MRHRVIVLCLVLASFLFANTTLAQNGSSPYLRFYAPDSHVFENEGLPFFIDLSNPGSESYSIVRVVVQFSKRVTLAGMDARCGQRIPNNQTQLVCTLTNVNPHSFYQLGFAVLGDLTNRPGFTVSVTAGSYNPRSGDFANTFSVLSQTAASSGLADGDPQIEGPSLTIEVARNVLFDRDRDGLGDVSEILAGSNPGDSRSLPDGNAVLDIAFLYSQVANDYYGGKLGSLVDNLITTTNQFFADNNVAITLRLAGLGLEDYDRSGVSLATVLEDFSDSGSPYFQDLDAIRVGTGADLMVYLHRIPESQAGEFCSIASRIDAIWGDYYPEAHAGRLLSVLNVDASCAGLPELGGPVAINMGVVASRIASPDGGTFPFSAGYLNNDGFATKEFAIGNSTAASEAFVLAGRLSDPGRVCGFSPCGVDWHDLAYGANTVFSLNATRYLVASLTPTVKSGTPDHRPTVSWDQWPALRLIQTSNSDAGIKGNQVSVRVELVNEDSQTLHDLRIRLLANRDEARFATADTQCRVLASDDLADGAATGDVAQTGEVVCFVRDLAPGQSAGFEYTVGLDEQVETEIAVPLIVSGRVNMWPITGSDNCIAFFDSAIHAQLALDPCLAKPADTSSLLLMPLQFDSTAYDPANSPLVTGTTLSVPYLRLFDGSLVSALFEIQQGDDVQLKLLDFQELDSSFEASLESEFTKQGQLILRNVKYNDSHWQIEGELLSDPGDGVFGNLTIQ